MRFSIVLPALAAAAVSPAAAQQVSPDAPRAYRAEVLADAAGRASSLAQAPAAFSVNVHGYTQFRYIWTQLDDDAQDDDTAVGFQASRARLTVSGNIIDERWSYFILFAFDGVGAADAAIVTLFDAYGSYRMENGWTLTFGQFRLPFLREELVTEAYQLAIDRSPTNFLFNQGRSQAVQIGFEGEAFRFAAAFSDGFRAANTDYTSDGEADWALTGRLEWKWAGDWRQFRDFTSFPDSPYAGMIGFAAHYQQGGDTAGTEDLDAWGATIDLSMEGSGWNLFAAAMALNLDPAGEDSTTDYGWLIQGGIFIAPQAELFARFDMILPDDDRAEFDDEFSTITAGINYYFLPESHAAKLTGQVIYFLDNPSQSLAPLSTRIPLLGSSEDGQWSILAQMQLVF
jgi:phosphate-selective porin OprO and OprP